jgi:hypothetical protein
MAVLVENGFSRFNALDTQNAALSSATHIQCGIRS